MIALLVAVSSCRADRQAKPDSIGDGPQADSAVCADMDLLERVGCFADLAVREGDLGGCDAAAHEGVKYQCYAVVAERQDDPLVCRKIPLATAEHLSLRDLCLSDIAKNRRDPEICSEVETVGFRDGCYFAVAEETSDLTLCTRINDDGLNRLCREGGGP